MDTWQPVSEEELNEILERELAACLPSHQEAFARCRIHPRPTPIVRFGNVESVFAVAERAGEVLYYEDVEEGFNFSKLNSSGGIAKPGFEQWELRHALYQWLGPGQFTQADAASRRGLTQVLGVICNGVGT